MGLPAVVICTFHYPKESPTAPPSRRRPPSPRVPVQSDEFTDRRCVSKVVTPRHFSPPWKDAGFQYFHVPQARQRCPGPAHALSEARHRNFLQGSASQVIQTAYFVTLNKEMPSETKVCVQEITRVKPLFIRNRPDYFRSFVQFLVA